MRKIIAALQTSVAAIMLPYNRGVWPRIFEQHLNAGDLGAVMALYESDSGFMSGPEKHWSAAIKFTKC